MIQKSQSKHDINASIVTSLVVGLYFTKPQNRFFTLKISPRNANETIVSNNSNRFAKKIWYEHGTKSDQIRNN